jgi:hypothetical protein
MRNVFKDIRVNDAKTLLTIDESKIPAELQGTRDELRKMVAEDKPQPRKNKKNCSTGCFC